MSVTSIKPEILRRRDVIAMTGLPTSTLYRAMAEKRFPQSIKLTRGAVGWLRTDIEDWIANLKKEAA